VLAPPAGELRVELGGALAEDAAFGLPCRPARDAAREVALTLGGRRDFPLGELEALALQHAFGGVRGAPAQHTPDGLLQLGDACPRGVSDALRLGLGAASGTELLDEVLGVAANALANLRELGLQLTDRRAGDRGPAVRGLEVRWAARAPDVDAVQREVFIVATTHGHLEALDERSLADRSAGVAGAISVRSSSRSVWASMMNSSVGSRARESGV
jgi:hypothetical protein